MTLRDEIQEQPDTLARLIDRAPVFGRIAERLRIAELDHVLIAARGTSDHAAIYAQYLFGIRLGMPVGLATPSVLSLYGAQLRLGRTLVLGISQSGASPDIVGVLEEGRRRGVPTIAITNDGASPLASTADEVIDLGVGPERAVAATKTYTAELAALALLVAAVERPSGPLAADPALREVPAAVAAALATEPAIAAAASDLAAAPACVVVGRGYEYATAREWALKLKELAHVVADPYSAADFRHGPVALVDEGFPVLAVAPSGRPAADMEALLRRLRDELGASVLVLSDVAGMRDLGTASVALPSLAEHLMPIASIVCGQLHALHVTLARNHDPDHPRHIAKVTRTE
jgi:glucosamine--fructose-6-phosphate aminotransferase (isomerizing)